MLHARPKANLRSIRTPLIKPPGKPGIAIALSTPSSSQPPTSSTASGSSGSSVACQRGVFREARGSSCSYLPTGVIGFFPIPVLLGSLDFLRFPVGSCGSLDSPNQELINLLVASIETIATGGTPKQIQRRSGKPRLPSCLIHRLAFLFFLLLAMSRLPGQLTRS